MKNLNSFNYVRKGLQHEVERGENLAFRWSIQQETHRYDESTGETILMRVKEGSADYRYFPEPTCHYYEIDDSWIEEVRAELPVFPKAA